MSRTRLRIAKETRLEVETKRGEWVSPQQMLDVVRRGHFDPRTNDVMITVEGTLHIQETSKRLVLPAGAGDPASPVELDIIEDASPGSREKKQNDLPFEAKDGDRVQIVGLWRPTSDSSHDRLILRRWKKASR